MEPQMVVIADPADLVADAGRAERINQLGKRSAVAQQLKIPITSTELFAQYATAQQQQLLLAVVDDEVVGFLKAGVKHLFYVDRQGIYTELDPLCLLDFYVMEDYQRMGIGARLFSYLLEMHHVQAAQVAYDRPSPKLIAFLKKYARLVEFLPQPNNFVIFNDFFTTTQ